MKSKKMLVLVLTIAFFVGSVGLGVHLLHKEAKATTSFTVFVHDAEEDPVEDLFITIEFYNGENWVHNDVLTWAETGVYTYSWEEPEEFTTWEAEIITANVWAVNPSSNPAIATDQCTWFAWEVLDGR